MTQEHQEDPAPVLSVVADPAVPPGWAVLRSAAPPERAAQWEQAAQALRAGLVRWAGIPPMQVAPVSRGLMQVVQPDPGAALARWADQRAADPLADLRVARRLVDQHREQQEALAAQSRYLREALERAAAQWYRVVALPLGASLAQVGQALAESLAPLGEVLERAQREALPPEARVARLRGEVAELATALDQWEAADLDPALSSPEGLARAGLLGVLAPRPPRGE